MEKNKYVSASSGLLFGGRFDVPGVLSHSARILTAAGDRGSNLELVNSIHHAPDAIVRYRASQVR